jgi:hypothetical protein
VAEVAIVTACAGGYDVPRAQAEQDIDVDWFWFGDGDGPEPPAPWRFELADEYDSPNLTAKSVKCRPPVDQDHVIWVDANMQITSPSFAREALAARQDGVAAWRHPRRDCIYDEAEASVGAESQGGKYDGQPIAEQVAHYRAEGHPEHGGLWACGTIAYDFTRTCAVIFGEQWFAECQKWSVQDQLSFPVVASRMGINPGVFPVPQIESRWPGWLANRWLRIHPHGR